MIELNNLTKHFDEITAVDHVTASIKDGDVFGLIGVNGAGKSTLLRMISGVIKPDTGTVVVDDMPIWDNVTTKQRIFFIPDEPYFFANGTAEDMEDFYAGAYHSFDRAQFDKELDMLALDRRRKVNTFSKGMKKQLIFLLGICAKTKYLLCDETFDGIDPIMRENVKNIMRSEMRERGLTPIFASHNLRELEDICNHVGVLHKGGILLDRDLDEMRFKIQKIQCVFDKKTEFSGSIPGLDIIRYEQRGRLFTFTVKGSREEAEKTFESLGTVFYEILPLTLEEIFISETEVTGYDFGKLILG